MNKEDIKLARQCLKFKGFNCENKECKNLSCPLNKYWGTSEKNRKTKQK